MSPTFHGHRILSLPKQSLIHQNVDDINCDDNLRDKS